MCKLVIDCCHTTDMSSLQSVPLSFYFIIFLVHLLTPFSVIFICTLLPAPSSFMGGQMDSPISYKIVSHSSPGYRVSVYCCCVLVAMKECNSACITADICWPVRSFRTKSIRKHVREQGRPHNSSPCACCESASPTVSEH